MMDQCAVGNKYKVYFDNKNGQWLNHLYHAITFENIQIVGMLCYIPKLALSRHKLHYNYRHSLNSTM